VDFINKMQYSTQKNIKLKLQIFIKMMRKNQKKMINGAFSQLNKIHPTKRMQKP